LVAKVSNMSLKTKVSIKFRVDFNTNVKEKNVTLIFIVGY